MKSSTSRSTSTATDCDTSQLKNLGSTLDARRATDEIERLLAQAFGLGACNGILRRAARRINDWAESATWGPDLRTFYSARDHILSRYIRGDLKELYLLRGGSIERPPKLSADQADLVVKHWPLVESEAQRIARQDTELHDRLTSVGRAELEKAIRRFDITRNVTFGAFVKRRIRGCMINYIERVWNREPEPRDFEGDRGKRWFVGLTPSPRVSTWCDPPTPAPKSRLIPGKRSQAMIESALATSADAVGP